MASSKRSFTPVFSKICIRCTFTVPAVIERAWAISLFLMTFADLLDDLLLPGRKARGRPPVGAVQRLLRRALDPHVSARHRAEAVDQRRYRQSLFQDAARAAAQGAEAVHVRQIVNPQDRLTLPGGVLHVGDEFEHRLQSGRVIQQHDIGLALPHRGEGIGESGRRADDNPSPRSRTTLSPALRERWVAIHTRIQRYGSSRFYLSL